MGTKHNVKLAALIMMSSIFFSRILGFFREMLIASTFGRGIETDAFYAAFTIPDVMFYLLIGGTLSAAFIPVFTSHIAKDDEEQGWKIASNFTNIIMLIILAFTVLGMIFTPYIVPLIAYKFQGEQLALTVKLTRIMFPAVAFTCLAGLGAGILNSYQKFAVSAFGPIVYNTGIILSLLILGKDYGIEGIAYGVVAGAAANFLIQLLALSGKLKFYDFKINPKQEGLNQIIRLAIPSIIGVCISQLNLIITQNIASGLDEGTITALRYANILMSLPVGIFAMGISAALFPTLTRYAALNNFNDYKLTFSLGIRTIFFITIPSAFGLAILSEPIVRLLFGSGKFTSYDVSVTAYALVFFTIGIAFQGGAQILTRGFYSIKDTMTPLKVGFVTLIANTTLNILFVRFTEFKIGGLSLSTALTAIVNLTILFIIFNRKMDGVHSKKILKSAFYTVLASIAMAASIYAVIHNITFNISNKFGQIVEVSICMGVGVVVFTLVALLLKMEEAHYILSLVKNKIRPAGNNN